LTHAPQSESRSIIDELLAEQRSMTAVERFGQKHETAGVPLQERFYRDLLPLSKPRTGEQYAFEVDLDQCTGCKACVAACHSLNGLEDDESWRAVGQLVSGDSDEGFHQTVTTACHHCVDPGCLHGCPVLAYEKDEITGIVRHLDDQCIGCQYCVLKCPYEVPQYSKRLGVVRKCDMCSSRLAVGEAPACVQSCPNAAIRITVVDQIAVAREHSRTANFLPASPDPRHTIPSTRYVTKRGLPEKLQAADASAVAPASGHWPLVMMLVLTQLSVGGVAGALTHRTAGGAVPFQYLAVSAAAGFAGIAASILHLGRPLHAWRAVLGVRRSWLSREILAFGAYASSALLLLVAEAGPLSWLGWPALAMAAVSGTAALVCSVMVYADTPREFWNWKYTGPRFTSTTVILGIALSQIFLPNPLLFAILSAVAVVRFVTELALFRNLTPGSSEALRRTALLQSQALLKLTIFRFATLLAGGVVLAQFAYATGRAGTGLATAIFLLLLASEFAERSLFFRSVAQPKMPGGLA
jgi:formate dehydrogenase iron-sulfur subunit